ncbi:hypothetical protein SDC9_207789 [bioreactor metagenome]|uniref:Uncharacterized protein n=1 Tax=bioreactor metagenome TaxID=1076179 RepID=A0A645J9G1_9ZZZZ
MDDAFLAVLSDHFLGDAILFFGLGGRSREEAHLRRPHCGARQTKRQQRGYSQNPIPPFEHAVPPPIRGIPQMFEKNVSNNIFVVKARR